MTTLVTLALFRKADDLWFDREIEVRATREKVEATVSDFGLPALKVVLEDIEYVGRTLGIAEIRAGKHLWERSMSEDRSPGSISYSDLGQVGRLGKKVVEMRMRIIRNSPETG